METIGERLKRIREDRGLTQRDIAAPGVSAQYISKIERGQRTASVKALRKLAPKLGVSARFLETGHDLTEGELRDYRLDDAELELRLGPDQAEAERKLLGLLEAADAEGDGRSSARARIGLGLLAAGRDAHADAIAALEPAVVEPWVNPVTHAEAFVALGASYLATQRTDDAVALYRGCLDRVSAQEPRSRPAAVRYATSLGQALIEAGELDDAREALAIAFANGKSVADTDAAAKLHWSAARAAEGAGDLDVAQSSMNRAVGLLELAEDSAQLARAYALANEISLLTHA
jgi:transcriptional regulator with XRE-family HTH domain